MNVFMKTENDAYDDKGRDPEEADLPPRFIYDLVGAEPDFQPRAPKEQAKNAFCESLRQKDSCRTHLWRALNGATDEARIIFP